MRYISKKIIELWIIIVCFLDFNVVYVAVRCSHVQFMCIYFNKRL